MKTKKFFYFAFICLAITVFVSCSSNPEKDKVVNETALMSGSTSQVTDIIGVHWKLVELNGNRLSENKAYFILHADNSVSGNGGCNVFFGTYTIESGNRISFSQMGASRMYCDGKMEVEKQLLQVFETADNFTINDDGTLSLNRARMASLARFVVVK